MLTLVIHRADGKSAKYSQPRDGAAQVVLRRLQPDVIFSGRSIVIGVNNPFTIVSTEHICYVEAITGLDAPRYFPEGIETIRRLSGRAEYEEALAKQWPGWRTNFVHNAESLLEAFVEVSLVSGEVLYLHATGRGRIDWEALANISGVLVATYEPNGTIYINPRAIVRARVYHSQQRVEYPDGLWFVDADDI